MRTTSPRFAVPLVATGFLAGWLTASWVSPPTAATQQRPARAVATPVDVPTPRVALDAVTAPRTTPFTLRNPFTFAGAGAVIAAADDRAPHTLAEGVSASDVDAAAPPPVVAAPPWRVIGVAATDDGVMTAVLSGGGEVLLLATGDRTPDGATVVEVGLAAVVIEHAGGRRETLHLP